VLIDKGIQLFWDLHIFTMISLGYSASSEFRTSLLRRVLLHFFHGDFTPTVEARGIVAHGADVLHDKLNVAALGLIQEVRDLLARLILVEGIGSEHSGVRFNRQYVFVCPVLQAFRDIEPRAYGDLPKVGNTPQDSCLSENSQCMSGDTSENICAFPHPQSCRHGKPSPSEFSAGRSRVYP